LRRERARSQRQLRSRPGPARSPVHPTRRPGPHPAAVRMTGGPRWPATRTTYKAMSSGCHRGPRSFISASLRCSRRARTSSPDARDHLVHPEVAPPDVEGWPRSPRSACPSDSCPSRSAPAAPWTGLVTPWSVRVPRHPRRPFSDFVTLWLLNANRGELDGIEEVGALQVLVTLGVAGVDACRS